MVLVMVNRDPEWVKDDDVRKLTQLLYQELTEQFNIVDAKNAGVVEIRVRYIHRLDLGALALSVDIILPEYIPSVILKIKELSAHVSNSGILIPELCGSNSSILRVLTGNIQSFFM